MNLFLTTMLVLVLANNYLLLLVDWELVGLCSYLRIGYWFEDVKNADAVRNAFVVNRIILEGIQAKAHIGAKDMGKSERYWVGGNT